MKVLFYLSAILFVFSSQLVPALAFERLDNSMTYELLGQSGNFGNDSEGNPYGIHYVKAGDTVDVWVKIKNMSPNLAGSVWYGKSYISPEGPNYPNAHAIGMGISEPRDTTPSWVDSSSFVINGNRTMYYDGGRIDKGTTIILDYKIKVKEGTPYGTYNLLMAPVREFDNWGVRVDSAGRKFKYQNILWKFVVGPQSNDVPANKVYTQSQYGFRFNYTPLGEEQLTIGTVFPEDPLLWTAKLASVAGVRLRVSVLKETNWGKLTEEKRAIAGMECPSGSGCGSAGGFGANGSDWFGYYGGSFNYNYIQLADGHIAEVQTPFESGLYGASVISDFRLIR